MPKTPVRHGVHPRSRVVVVQLPLIRSEGRPMNVEDKKAARARVSSLHLLLPSRLT